MSKCVGRGQERAWAEDRNAQERREKEGGREKGRKGEVSDGKQYGCVWDSDAFELGSGDEGRDVEKGLAELSDPYNKGPCQRGDECSPIELKD